MNTFAENLRQRISDLGLTQAEAARRCDLENRRFHHYIVGDREPDLGTLVRIATVLGTTPNELLGARPTTDEPTDEACRLRAKLIATVGNMDPPALRLMSVLADGVIAFIREGRVADETGARTDRRSEKRRQ